MTGYTWPNGALTIPRVTSEFGMRLNPVTHVYSLHAGIDLIGFSLNLACTDGVVTFARYNGGAGNEIRVKHDDGTESRYKHNARMLVSLGQRVARGTALGVQGRTGDATGIHLHFETRTGPLAAAQNPRTFMAAHIGSSSAGGTTTPLPDERQGASMSSFRLTKGANGQWVGVVIHELADILMIDSVTDNTEYKAAWRIHLGAWTVDPNDITIDDEMIRIERVQLEKRRSSFRKAFPSTATVDIDEAALAAALGPLLVDDADLAAAVAALKAAFPTTFIAKPA